MSSEKSQKGGHSRKILKILAEKPAISLNSLKEAEDIKTTYALTRSVKNLIEAGYAQIQHSDNQDYVRITKKGKTKINSIRLEGGDALVAQTWDGLWRIIILDIGEDRKSEREALRYLLKKANFVCIKNTVWISPYPYEHLFTNIKKDLSLTTELMIIVTDKLDPETNLAFLNATKN
jgi:DNA-binding transcriptional regulator PaaX